MRLKTERKIGLKVTSVNISSVILPEWPKMCPIENSLFQLPYLSTKSKSLCTNYFGLLKDIQELRKDLWRTP